jgi:hypothetical protein
MPAAKSHEYEGQKPVALRRALSAS